VLDAERTVQVTVSADDGEEATLRVFSRTGTHAGWTLHATAGLRPDPGQPSSATPTADTVRARCPNALEASLHYERLAQLGADFGPGFRSVRRLWRGAGEALVEVEVPAGLLDAARYHLHPALLDGCLQAAAAVTVEQGTLPVPVSVEGVRVFRSAGQSAWGHARVEERPGGLVADIDVLDPGGELVAELRGVTFRPAQAPARVPATAPLLHHVVWRRSTRRPAPAALHDRWLVVPDAGGTGAALARALLAQGAEVTLAPAPRDLPDADAWQALVTGAPEPWAGVVHLAGLDAVVDERTDSGSVQAAALDATASVIGLVQRLGRAGAASRLWVVTRAAQTTLPDARVALAQAPLWGLARTVALEHPELRPTLVDLDPAANADAVAALVDELLGADDERQVALRGQERLVARLAPSPGIDDAAALAPPTLRLDIPTRGVLEDLAWVAATRGALGPAQIEIRARAVGLNFRDVLNALGMYPGEAGPLGSECVGEIVAVGSEVRDLRVGDLVMCVATGAFASTVVTDAALAVRVPASLTPEAAATVPIAFLTARYALAELARLSPGQRVLIHAGAGGVGMAAIQVARRVGAEIFATAGSPHKRQLLASLGVAHVMDSRSVGFADELMARTGGEGVDVVMNSLSGEFIPKSLGALRPGGCFVELGKRDVWEPARVSAVRPDVRYHVVYLGDSFASEPARIHAMLTALADDLAAGRLEPLPHRVFGAADVAEAFRVMAQARHVGKIVVRTPGGEAPAPPIRADASYLVTGGAGALGLHTAEWLHARGARHLVLMGRSPLSSAARERVARLEREGSVVRIVHGDVACAEDVTRALGEIETALPRLRGIVHAAGIVEDAMVPGQTRAGLASVMAPKVAGAWNLHRATAPLELDFFVLYSSMAGVLGSAGQGNYAAANAFLDALAAHRRAQGQRALAIQWGPWSQGGMAAALGEYGRRRWAAQGIRELGAGEALVQLERLLAAGTAATASAAPLPIAWERYVAALAGGAPPFLRDLVRAPANGARATAVPPRPALLAQLAAAPRARRRHLLLAHVREQAALVLQLPKGHALDPDQGFKELGLDSLMAVELRNRLRVTVGHALPTTLAFDHPTAAAVTDFLARVLDIGGDEGPSEPSGKGTAADAVRALSDEEATELLLAELAHETTSGAGKTGRI
jgi:NADPH:quinone reductase-like Zn-dependent oxidoreductase